MAKFLIVHPNLDIYGGGERVAHHIIKTLVTRGQQVELLAFDFDEDRYREIIGENLPNSITVHTLGNRAIVEAEPPLSVYKRRRNIIKLLKKFKAAEQYDYTFCTQTISAFEAALFDEAKKNVAYVHFPEIHYDYNHSKSSKKIYLWPYKKLLEPHISQLDLVFCNSNYTKAMIQEYWSKFGVVEPIVAYPPVETPFWSDKPFNERANRVVYVGRFIPNKRHEILKQLAVAFPQLQFVSVGLLGNSERTWFDGFSKKIPVNYMLKPNLPEAEKIRLLQDSTVYCHLMENEHFGIAPMEALASGCLTLVHNSGGAGEFVPSQFRWSTFEDLKSKIAKAVDSSSPSTLWQKQKEEIREKISVLKPECFEEQIWTAVEALI
jgi:glycosyltransferase involved in cell wall biosynthesis